MSRDAQLSSGRTRQRKTASERILLTGATGFIGRHLLHGLLQGDADREVHCLIRAGSSGEAKARLESVLNDPTAPPMSPANRARCHAVWGDIGVDGLATKREMPARVDRIIHCAA